MYRLCLLYEAGALPRESRAKKVLFNNTNNINYTNINYTNININTVVDADAYRQRQRLSPLTATPNPPAALQRLVGALLHAAARASQQLAAETDLPTATALLESQCAELLRGVLQPLATRPGAIDWAWDLYTTQLQGFVASVLGAESAAAAAFQELWVGLPWEGARFFCRAPTDLSDFGTYI